MSNVQDPTNTHDQEQGRAAHLDTAHVGNIEGAWGTINVNDMAPRKTWLKRLITLLVIMGPGLITMVGDNDAGGVATYTQAGRLACSSYAPTCSSRSSCSSSKRCNSLSVADTRDHLHAKTFAARSLHCILAVRAWGSGQACVEVHARSDLKRGTNTMSTERVKPNPGRLDLEAIDAALQTVEMHWTQIDDELDRRGIGRKDTPFTALIRLRMMSAYQYLDELLAQQTRAQKG